jgi:hypothetical protein
VRLAPLTTLQGAVDDTPQATYLAAAHLLGELGVGYLHIAEADWDDAPLMPVAFKQALRMVYPGTLIYAGKYTAERAEQALAEGWADLIGFGRPFIANPDLPERLRTGAALNPPDRATFLAVARRLHRLPDAGRERRGLILDAGQRPHHQRARGAGRWPAFRCRRRGVVPAAGRHYLRIRLVAHQRVGLDHAAILAMQVQVHVLLRVRDVDAGLVEAQLQLLQQRDLGTEPVGRLHVAADAEVDGVRAQLVHHHVRCRCLQHARSAFINASAVSRASWMLSS